MKVSRKLILAVSAIVMMVFIVGIASVDAIMHQNKISKLQKVTAVVAEHPRGNLPRALVTYGNDSKEMQVSKNVRKGDRISAFVRNGRLVEEDSGTGERFLVIATFLTLILMFPWLGIWVMVEEND